MRLEIPWWSAVPSQFDPRRFQTVLQERLFRCPPGLGLVSEWVPEHGISLQTDRQNIFKY